jgi:hypothetical protein
MQKTLMAKAQTAKMLNAKGLTAKALRAKALTAKHSLLSKYPDTISIGAAKKSPILVDRALVQTP